MNWATGSYCDGMTRGMCEGCGCGLRIYIGSALVTTIKNYCPRCYQYELAKLAVKTA